MGRNNIAFIIIGLLALAMGLALRLFVGRRRFTGETDQGFKASKITAMPY